jgi:hypothetical protein
MAVTESLVVDGDEIAAGFGVFEPPPLKRGAGRPTAYDAQIADQICDRVADGEFIHVICADPGFPKHRTVRDWTQRYPEFKAAYEQAKHCKHERLMDECLQIADAATKETLNLAEFQLAERHRQLPLVKAHCVELKAPGPTEITVSAPELSFDMGNDRALAAIRRSRLEVIK